ncbi:MAG TPA: glutathione synthase [Gammaproteobacteria bacterium]|nr:glutathione synthase [Gammaproteobacteria bacterium]
MIKIGIIMDPIASIKPYKDSSFAMLLAAQSRGWEVFYMEMNDLSMIDSTALGQMRPLQVSDQHQDWYSTGAPLTQALSELDIILMRKDPPFDMEYIYATYLLQFAHDAGTLVVNRPDSLRNANEKLSASWFRECTVPTLVSRRAEEYLDFLKQHHDLILKPLDGMGGASIFRVREGDPNTSVIIETLTDNGNRYAMAQRMIPEISAGDKRILLINGEPVPWALARIPAKGETRGNLAAGGRGEGVALTERDRWICQQVGPRCREMGLLFVGIDVIGDYLTEINVTSPTCIRELDQLYQLDIAGQLMDSLQDMLS